jgi:hypothetical protein
MIDDIDSWESGALGSFILGFDVQHNYIPAQLHRSP